MYFSVVFICRKKQVLSKSLLSIQKSTEPSNLFYSWNHNDSASVLGLELFHDKNAEKNPALSFWCNNPGGLMLFSGRQEKQMSAL